jgi:transposase
VGAGRVVVAAQAVAGAVSGPQAAVGSPDAVGEFVLHTGIAWMHLPQELGYGSGYTCWRRLDEWQQAGVWDRLHALLLTRLRAAGEIEWSRAIVDASHVQAKKGAPKRARARSIEAGKGRSIIFSSTRPGSRSRSRSPAATAMTSRS